MRYNATADVLYFDGHGVPGLVSFTNQFGAGAATTQAWGVGNTSGSWLAGPLTFSSLGLPISGRLKWLVLNSSDSVAAPPQYDSADPDWTANWRKAFGGSLHGVYGSWQQPGTCATGGISGRTCDLSDDNLIQQEFVGYALPNPLSPLHPPQNQGGAMHDSWEKAMQNENYDGSWWSEMEDTFAMSDIVSGPGTGGIPPSYTGVLSGIEQFSYSLSPNNLSIVATPQRVSHGTFTLQAYGLQNESVNHASIEQQYATYFNEPPVISDDGSTYRVMQWPVKFEHMYGLSGGMVRLGCLRMPS
jgi:hypothetical protein